jgi:hypothetical protein
MNEIWEIAKDALVIPAVAFVGLVLFHNLWTARAVVIIQVPDLLYGGVTRFGLNAVTTGVPYRLRTEHRFRHIGRQRHLVARWRYRRGVVAVFKCFVDHAGVEFSTVKSALEGAGFAEIRKSAAKPNRAYFLVPGFAVDVSDPAHRNNRYYPS